MKNTNKILGINKKVVIIIHKIALVAMLFYTIAAPCQSMIQDVYGSHKIDFNNYISSNSGLLDEKHNVTQKTTVPNKVFKNDYKNLNDNLVENENNSFQINADITEGIIGVSNTNPLDDAKDNLFKFYIKNLPNQNFKTYLTYELFGVQDYNGVTRSINNRQAIGGYIVKNQKGWTSQKEEINMEWLRLGENQIMFSIPKGANYQYQIKNIKLEFEINRSNNILPSLVVNNTSLNYIKDNQLYVKGFLRNCNSDIKVYFDETPLNLIKGEFEGFLKLTDALKNQKFVMVKALDTKGLLGQELISLDNLLEADKFFIPEENFKPTVNFVKARTNTIIKTEGASIKINDSALLENKEISISKIRNIDIAPMSSGLVNVSQGGYGFRFLPDGTKFNKPVALEIAYDENLIPKGHNANEITTFYFNTKTKAWTPIERDTINKTDKSIISLINQSGDYINGIIQTPESPETAGFTPTMMNDIKAVDPSSEMTLISPPEVSQKGDANVSYPIKIPAGRKGMQPQIAIQYNNEGGNGWLGQGWSISMPSVSIDTKWGAPTFNPTEESEIYSLNGQQLMYPKQNDADWMPNRHYDVAGSSTSTYNTHPIARIADLQFTTRKQGSFAKIERLGDNPINYHWKVTNTDGSINWYGGKNDVESNAVIRNNHGDIVHWGLFMTQDVYGNCVKYLYDNSIIPTQSGQNENLNDGVIFHIQNIQYTGYNDADYKYEIIFNSSHGIRDDVSINARLGVKQIEPYFLDNIIIKKVGINENIRKYTLKMGYGKFGKGRLNAISELDKNDNLFYNHKFDYYDDISIDGQDVFFSSGVSQTICNDTPVPCKDTDGDEICDDNDSCPTVYGSVANAGCPEGENIHCYDVKLPVGDLFNECAHIGLSVLVNGDNLPGQPFHNLNDIISALQLYHPTATYNNSSNLLTISNPSQIYTTLDIAAVNGNTHCSWKLNFNNCSTKTHKFNSKLNPNNFFSNLLAKNTFTLQNGIDIDNPCGSMFTNIDFLLSGYIPSFDSSASLLGSSKSQAISTGFYIGLGIGKNMFTKMTTFGVQWNWGNDKSTAMTALIDINGDGLEDIVSKEGNSLYYKKHIVERTYDINNEPIITHSFQAKRPITGIDNFYRAFGRNRSSNFQITFGLKKIGGFIGWDKSKSNSETDMFFTDGNGDGLMDIVRDGVVYFNRLDANGNPNYIPDSIGTENLVITAAPKTVDVPDVYNQQDITLPAFDVVKVWEAPSDGTIKIDNTIQLTDTSKEAIATVEIKKNIPINCYSVSFPVPQKNLSLYKYTTSVIWNNITPLVNNNQPCSDPIVMGRYSRALRLMNINQQPTDVIIAPNNLYLFRGSTPNFQNNCPYGNPIETNFELNTKNWLQTNSLPFSNASFFNPNILNTTYTFTDSNNNLFVSSGFDCSFFSNYISPTASTNPDTFRIDGSNDVLDSQYPGFVTAISMVSNNSNLPINVPIPVSTNIAINSNLILNNPYNLTNDFTLFKNQVESQYSNTSVSIDLSVTPNIITINTSNSILQNITLTNIETQQVNSYSFSPCSTNKKRDFDTEWKITQVNPLDKNIAINKWLAEGNELKIPLNKLKQIHLLDFEGEKYYYIKSENDFFWYNIKNEKINDRDIIKKLNEKITYNINDVFKTSLINFNKIQLDRRYKNIEEANDYLKKQSKKNETILNNIASRTINQTTCSETPNELCLLYGSQLNASNINVTNTLTNNCSGQPLTVKKGDRIYFRIHSIDNGNPPINWNPKIEYTNNGLSTITDANGHKPFSSSYSDSFVLSAKSPVPFPGNSGSVKVDWTSFSVTPSDKVIYQIVKRVYSSIDSGSDNDAEPTQLGADEIIYQKTCNANSTTTVATSNNEVIGLNMNNYLVFDQSTAGNVNLSQTFFYFKVISTSNVDWKNFVWKPSMEFTTTTSISPNQDGSNPEGNVVAKNTVYPIPDYDLYRFYPCGTAFAKKDVSTINNGVGLSITPQLSGVFSGGDVGKINFVVKSGNQLIGSRTYTINGTSVTTYNTNPISLSGLTSSTIEIMFTVDDSENEANSTSLLSKLALTSNVLAKISYGTTNTNVPKSEINLYQKTYPKFGAFYRNWGQFMYRPANVQNALPGYGNSKLIKEEALQITLDQNQVSNLNNDLDGVSDTMTSNQLATFQSSHQGYIDSIAFISANPSREEIDGTLTDRWIGFHKENYASEFAYRAEKMSLSINNFEDNYPNIEQGVVETGAYAISKYAQGHSNNNFSAGVNGWGYGVNGSISMDGENNSLTDYVDYNGDRYPDIVTTNSIQYTNKTGGLFDATGNNGQDISTSSSDSSGFGASGSFGKSNQELGAKDGEGANGFKRFDGFRGNSGAGISGNFTNGTSTTKRIWTDINGDGLSDLIATNTVMVAGVPTGVTNVTLNFGPNTSNTVVNNWGTLPLFYSESSGVSGGLGINKWQGSVEAGLSLTTSWNKTTNTLVDINGDGLLDMIYAGDNLGVKLNLGNRFVDKGIWTTDYNLKKESASVAASLNIGFSFALVWKFGIFNIKAPATNWNGTPLSTSTNKTKKSMTDFDGDGFVDLVEEVSPNNVKVYHSRIRRTDLLKSVTNPLGGKFTIDYKVQPVDYNNPQAKWAMSDVIIEDNYNKVNDGIDVYKKHFVYENGRYDRREREFYGYKTVKVEDYISDSHGDPVLYRTTVSNYLNKSYFLNGLLDDSFVIKGGDLNKKFSRTKNYYEIYKLNNTNDEIDFSVAQPLTYDVGGSEGRRSATVLLTKTVNELYELNSSPQLITEVDFKYDNKGRVIVYTNKGNISNSNDDYVSTIDYHNSMTGINIINVPSSIKVTTNSSGLVRERATEVDTSNGNIQKISAKNNGSWSDTYMKYDQYGNLIHIEYPQNSNGESMFYDYTYDSEYNKYVVNIKDVFGYNSSANYNSDFDKIEETIDLAGNKMRYRYDSFGRNTLIIAPKEIEAGRKYTIKFDYYPYFSDLPTNNGVTYDPSNPSNSTFVPVAITSHFDQQHPDNDIQTFTFIDGLARPIQVKKDIWIDRNVNPHDPEFIEALSVSGKTHYDELGRAIQQFHPWWEVKQEDTKFLLNEYASPYKSASSLDELDRPIKTVDPANNLSTMQYSLATDVTGVMAIKTLSDVEQNNTQHIITETFKDVAGRVISTKNVGGNSGAIWTKFKYNEIGELMSYTDAQDITTTYKYDMLGRKVMVNHPDNGVTTFKYDNVNLISLQTANLNNIGTTINYNYEINRLKNIQYPDTPAGNSNLANVYYKYGNSGNQTGRLIWQQDATGTQEFEYGNMGEMISNVRTVVGPNIPTRIYKTHFEYDSWNRLQTLIYPDGEKVAYNYDLGGNLIQMTGEYNGAPYEYIKRIDYDYYEQRTYLLYGNATETKYNYSPQLRRLSTLNVKTSDGNDLFYNKYDYDKVGNVINIDNSADVTANAMAGRYQHRFEYDNLNRLSKADGTFNGDMSQINSGNDTNSNYHLSMHYNDTHGIINKTQEHIKNGNAFHPNTYNNEYQYIANTHKVEKIVDNTTGDEEHFKYDLNGNITYRETEALQRNFYWDESNRLRVVSDNHDMQHYIYDASGERVLKSNSDVEAIYENGTLVNTSTTSINGYTSYPSAFMVVTADGVYSKHYYAGSQRIVSRLGDHDAGMFEPPCVGCYKTANSNFDDKKLQRTQKADLQQYADKANKGTIVYKDYKPIPLAEQEKAIADENEDKIQEKAPQVVPIYYYHPDHLGTSTALTDFNGNAYQFFLNLPFGETMAQQLGSNYYNTPYKFNGKELDEETGLYYYGARYYDPKISIFQSTDQLMEETPSVNAYVYCNSNPIRYIDPTGMSSEEAGPPKKNIYIVITEPGEEFKFNKDFKENGWYTIIAKDLEQAETEVNKYLSGGTADNILIEAHGGQVEYPDGVKSSGMRYGQSTDKITGIELTKYKNGETTNIDKCKIEALVSITKQCKSVNLLVCNINYDNTDSFGISLSSLAPGVDIILSADKVGIMDADSNRLDDKYGRRLFDSKTTYDGIIDKPLGVDKYFGWTKYNSGKVVSKFKDAKITVNGSISPIR
jgi:RHS repeat-associated protein